MFYSIGINVNSQLNAGLKMWDQSWECEDVRIKNAIVSIEGIANEHGMVKPVIKCRSVL